MSQLDIFAEPVLAAARAQGAEAADRCADKATRVTSFSTEAAREWVLRHLDKHGPTSGEDLVDGMCVSGIAPHDTRAFGTVFASLAREGRIEHYGFALRRKGRGTSGAVIWRIVR